MTIIYDLRFEHSISHFLMVQAMHYHRGRRSGKQQHDLCTKALMRGLGTSLECRHTFFERTEKDCGNLLLGKNSMVVQWTQTDYP